ncbi:MAG: glycosyltransferase family 2 protein [archaeon]|nr:glycosyltransferase family 2 protein [archaeon]
MPAFNEEKTIANIIKKLKNYVDDVIVCDDGSSDMTSFIAKNSGAVLIRNSKNKGKGVAFDILFKEARRMNADVVVTLDADGQHDPDDIPKIIKPILNDDFDIVIGSRFLSNNNIPKHKLIGNYILNLLANILSGSKFTDTQSGFRAYSKRALESIRIKERDIGVDSQIIMDAVKMKLKVKEVPIRVYYNDLDTSTYNPIKHTLKVIKSVIKYKFIH